MFTLSNTTESFKDLILRNSTDTTFISLDLFDTLLLRDVLSPSHVFLIVEKLSGIKGFAKARQQAELLAAKNLGYTFEDIYRHVQSALSLSDSEIARLKQLEIDVERRVIRVNTKLVDLIGEILKEFNGKLILLSDMYLSSKVLKSFLPKNIRWLQNAKIYVSCEHEGSKYSGDLYKKVATAEKVDYKDWVHIGDNKVADINVAKRLGIQTLYIPNPRADFYNKVFEKRHISYLTSLIFGFSINKLVLEESDYWNKVATLVMFPVHFALGWWIVTKINREQPDAVFFLSRDGYIPYHLVENLLTVKRKLKKVPHLEYLYVSRKYLELFYWALVDNKQEFERAYHEKPVLWDDINNQKQTFESSDDAYRFFKGQIPLYKEYLFNRFKDKKQAFLFDVGWRGTPVKLLFQILKEVGIDTSGYKALFLGLLSSAHSSVLKVAQTFSPPNKRLGFHALMNPLMIEFLFSAPHGKFMGFNEDKKPIFQRVPRKHQKIQQILSQKVFSLSDEFYRRYGDLLDSFVPTEILEYLFYWLENPDYEDLYHFSNHTQDIEFLGFHHLVPTVSKEEFKRLSPKKLEELSKNAGWKKTLFIRNTTKEEFYHLINTKKLTLGAKRLEVFDLWLIKRYLMMVPKALRILVTDPLRIFRAFWWRYIKR